MSRKDTKPAMDKLVRDVIVPELEKLIGTGYYDFWSEEREAILTRYYSRVPNSAIAKHIGCSVAKLMTKAGRMGLSRPRKTLN